MEFQIRQTYSTQFENFIKIIPQQLHFTLCIAPWSRSFCFHIILKGKKRFLWISNLFVDPLGQALTTNIICLHRWWGVSSENLSNDMISTAKKWNFRQWEAWWNVQIYQEYQGKPSPQIIKSQERNHKNIL